jgi:hypothetical protein
MPAVDADDDSNASCERRIEGLKKQLSSRPKGSPNDILAQGRNSRRGRLLGPGANPMGAPITRPTRARGPGANPMGAPITRPTRARLVHACADVVVGPA